MNLYLAILSLWGYPLHNALVGEFPTILDRFLWTPQALRGGGGQEPWSGGLQRSKAFFWVKWSILRPLCNQNVSCVVISSKVAVYTNQAVGLNGHTSTCKCLTGLGTIHGKSRPINFCHWYSDNLFIFWLCNYRLPMKTILWHSVSTYVAG